MTSNFADRLDKALIRINKQIYLGQISPQTAELMFLNFFARGGDSGNETLAKLALEFSQKILENTVTPAQVQGYLLDYRNSPGDAAANIAAWIEEEKTKTVEAEVRAENVLVSARVGLQNQSRRRMLTRTNLEANEEE